MSDNVVIIEELGKRYRIGGAQRASHFTLRDSISAIPRRSISRLRGQQARSEEFWALKDVSFEIKQGEVIGLVGENGAGKSTLLKILSRIVEPTTGRAILHGRVSSLLEVGTGFHFELSGRENIFLNGAILGMRRKEIQSKFDEIVEFSEVEKFLETPVKFYSSGMAVRLAFAIAAHLEPDILIVDEVLAVGDRAFQKKSLGKMGSVARAGRTVIFVSHNMTAVLDLCEKGALLEHGRVTSVGPIEEIVGLYVQADATGGTGRFVRPSYNEREHLVSAVELRDGTATATDSIDYGDSIRIRIETNAAKGGDFGVELRLKNSLRQPVAYASNWIGSETGFQAGETVEVTLPRVRLMEGTYFLDIMCRVPGGRHVDNWADDVVFNVVNAVPGALTESIKASDDLGSIVLEDTLFTTV